MSKLQTELEKIKEMSVGEALDYIWTYYKLPILGTVFGLLFLITLITDISANRKLDPVVRVGILSDIDFLYPEEFSGMLSEAYPDATGNYAPEKYDVSSVSNPDDPYASVQLATYLGAGQLDCLICDEAIVQYLGGESEEFSVTDITDTRLGALAQKAGIEPLCFILINKAENADSAAFFLKYLQK